MRRRGSGERRKRLSNQLRPRSVRFSPGSSDGEENTPRGSTSAETEDAERLLAWPVHAEENARLNEARQRAIAEQAELTQARQLWASREAERIRVEAEEGKRVVAFQARAGRKASATRIQIKQMNMNGTDVSRTRNPDKSDQDRCPSA